MKALLASLLLTIAVVASPVHAASDQPAAAALAVVCADPTHEDSQFACVVISVAAEAAWAYGKTIGQTYGVCIPPAADINAFRERIASVAGYREAAAQYNIHGFFLLMLRSLYSCNDRHL